MKVLSMRGKQIDMARLIAMNSQQIALGNASMNARGDLVGSGGVIVKPREEIAREYHKANPRIVKQVSLRDLPNEAFMTPDQIFRKEPQSVEPQSVETQSGANIELGDPVAKNKPKRNLSNE